MTDKLSDPWREFISRWCRNFTAYELVVFVRQLKGIRADEVAALEQQIVRAMDAMGLAWGDLEGFGGAVEGICDTMESLKLERATLQQRVERLERIKFWATSLMNSQGADTDSRRSARAGLMKALAEEEA